MVFHDLKDVLVDSLVFADFQEVTGQLHPPLRGVVGDGEVRNDLLAGEERWVLGPLGGRGGEKRRVNFQTFE